MIQEATSGKRPHRSHAERSAATRRLLLDTAIKCLFEHGYGKTSARLIADQAGISRGALLHQFPANADLMTYVVEAVFDEELAMYRQLLNNISEPDERLVALPLAVWQVLSRPAGVAVLEIMQGSRSDRVLAEKLKPIAAKIDAFTNAGLPQGLNRTHSTPLLRLIVGAIRGLSIMQVLAPEGEDVIDAVRELQRLLCLHVEVHASTSEEVAVDRPRKKPLGHTATGSRQVRSST